MNRFHYLETVS